MSLLLLFRPRKGVTGAFDITPGKSESKKRPRRKKDKRVELEEERELARTVRLEQERVDKKRKEKRETHRKRHLELMKAYLMMEGDND